MDAKEDPTSPTGRPELAKTQTSTEQQRPPLPLRRRTSSRFYDENIALSPRVRRRSSVLSNGSYNDARMSFSSDNLLAQPDGQEGSMSSFLDVDSPNWEKYIVAIGAIPIIAGFFYSDGHATATDIILLALAMRFMVWSAVRPWDWYRATHPLNIVYPDVAFDDTIMEESDGESMATAAEDYDADNGPSNPISSEQAAAFDKLRRNERYALMACILGPILGGFILHLIRPSLSKGSQSWLASFNITMLVLFSEVRPVKHLLQLMDENVQRSNGTLRRAVEAQVKYRHRVDQTTVEELSTRLRQLEAQQAASNISGGDNRNKEVELTTKVRKTLQPQVDALNRAVRSYEKRSLTQSMQADARFRDLEAKLQDAISLAAAASRNSQQQAGGILDKILTWTVGMMTLPFKIALSIALYPLQLVEKAYVTLDLWLFPPRKVKKTRSEKKDHGSVNGRRIQSTSVRR